MINSAPSVFITRQPDRLRRHIVMLLADHPFMEWDSYIACDDTVLVPTRTDLVVGLRDKTIEHLGFLSAAMYPLVVAASCESSLIADRDKELIRRAFGVP